MKEINDDNDTDDKYIHIHTCICTNKCIEIYLHVLKMYLERLFKTELNIFVNGAIVINPT